MIADQARRSEWVKAKRKGDPTGSAFDAKRIVLLQIGRELKFPRSRLFGNVETDVSDNALLREWLA